MQPPPDNGAGGSTMKVIPTNNIVKASRAGSFESVGRARPNVPQWGL